MSLTNPPVLPRLTTVFYRLGLWVMFNFGFGDVIDRIEKHFGKAVTRIFLAIVGAALTIFVIGFAVKESVYPLALWMGSVVSGQPDVSGAISGFGTVASIIWIVVMLALIVSFFQSRGDLNRGTELLAEIKTLQSEIETAEDETRQKLAAMMTEAKSAVEQAQKMVNEAETTVARAEDALSQVTQEDAAPVVPKRRRKTVQQG